MTWCPVPERWQVGSRALPVAHGVVYGFTSGPWHIFLGTWVPSLLRHAGWGAIGTVDLHPSALKPMPRTLPKRLTPCSSRAKPMAALQVHQVRSALALSCRVGPFRPGSMPGLPVRAHRPVSQTGTGRGQHPQKQRASAGVYSVDPELEEAINEASLIVITPGAGTWTSSSSSRPTGAASFQRPFAHCAAALRLSLPKLRSRRNQPLLPAVPRRRAASACR